MKNKVKILLVGVGGYGNTYLNSLLDTKRTDDVEIAGMVDPFPQSCKRLDEALGRGIKLYKTMAEFYAENTADLAVISTPIHLHTPMIKEALSNGSNVLCEKPLCGDARDIPSLIEARNKSGKFVSIGYQLSHSDAMLALKRDIIAGKYGAPKTLKTVVLWPRDKKYYSRGIGWAGKMRAADGSLILDSVINNATAHYLNNLFFVLGKSVPDAPTPVSVKAELYRANDIETFDTATVECTFADGVKAYYFGSHAVDQTLNPHFDYIFDGGVIKLDGNDPDRCVVGTLADGTVIEYGNPFEKSDNKLWMAVDIIQNGGGEIVSGIETAAPHTLCIAALHRDFEVSDFPQESIKVNDREITYMPGLYDALIECYDREVMLSEVL